MMKKALSFAAAVLMLIGVVISPVNAYAYTYVGNINPTPVSITLSADPSGTYNEDKEFKNDSRAFTVNSPSANQKYTVGEEISLSLTPQMYFNTVLPGGFSSNAADNIVMSILKGNTVEKIFRVNYYGDDLGKTFTGTFTPTEEGTYKVNIYYRGSTYSGQNFGNYYIKVVNAPKKANTIVVKTSAKKVKFKKVKKKDVTVKAITVKKAKGAVTYTKVSGKKNITIDQKTGKLLVKKGTKKGTYKIKVRITAEGTAKYKSKTINKTVKIKVK